MQDEIDAINDRLDQNDSDLSDAADAADERMTDIENTQQDQSALVGQLDFPLNQDSIDRIKEVFPTGTATLSGGSVTVTDGRIGLNSTVLFSVVSAGGTQGFISTVLGVGSVTFSSNSGADTSKVKYVIF